MGFLFAIHMAVTCLQTKNTAFCPSITRVEISAIFSQPVFVAAQNLKVQFSGLVGKKNILAFCSYYGGRAREFLVAYYLPGGPTDQNVNVEYVLFSLKNCLAKKKKSQDKRLLSFSTFERVLFWNSSLWFRVFPFYNFILNLVLRLNTSRT